MDGKEVVMRELSPFLERMERDGYAIVPQVFRGPEIEVILAALAESLARTADDGSIRTQQGSTYAARNVLKVFPWTANVWRQPPLPELLAALLGPAFGLVRALYFDKPPERTWSLPLHKDMTIAVQDNRRPSEQFRKPTRKAGVPHVEAPTNILETMATVRIHLDDMTAENGALQIVPTSHRTGKRMELGAIAPRSIFVERGDVMLMRPLLIHGSVASRPGTQRHRRILHLEFAAREPLPDGYAWHTFLPGGVVNSPGARPGAAAPAP
jgi:hypothetical protein